MLASLRTSWQTIAANQLTGNPRDTDDLARLIEQYRAGIVAELNLLKQLAADRAGSTTPPANATSRRSPPHPTPRR